LAASVGVSPAPSWVVPVIPAGKSPSVKDFADGYYFSFSDMQVNLEKKTTYYRSIKNIVTESGIQNGSEISVIFDPSYEKVNFHTITIWREGKSVNQLKISDFKVMPQETDRQRFIYNGNYSASLVLKDIRKGDRIEFSYSVSGWNSVFQNKYSGIFSFSTYDYISHVHYAIISENGRFLNFKDFNKPPVKTLKKSAKSSIYEWDIKNLKNIPFEEHTPSWFYNYPYVQVTEFRSWKEVVDWGLQLYQIPEISGELKAKVDLWKKTSGESDYEFIEKAVRFVQDEIRYLGVETGENSHRPHKPEDVFKQRYGDCKDKVSLLCALLRANKIECDPVLVDTYYRSHVLDYLPTPSDFNHVVARFAVGDKQKTFHFVDATSVLQGGAATQISFPDYGAGLPLRPGQKDLIPIAGAISGSVSVTEDIRIPDKFDSSGVGSLFVKTVYFDQEANNIRSILQGGSFSETEKNYLNYYRDTYKHAEFEILDSLEFYDQRQANNISLVERYNMKNGWQYDSTRHKYTFLILGKILYDQLINLPNRPRKNPVSLRYPYRLDYRIRLALPTSQSVIQDQWEIKREAYEIKFSSKFISAENIWELHYDYAVLKDHILPEQVSQFRKDMDKLYDYLEYELNDSDGPAANGENLNIGMVLFGILVFGGSLWVCLKLYKYSPGTVPADISGLKIDGWLILLAIGLLMRLLLILSTTLTGSFGVYFTNSGWDSVLGQSGLKLFTFHFMFLVELAVILFGACFTGLLLVLFFKKRDSFPVLYSVFMAGTLAYLIVDAAVINLFFNLSVSGESVSQIIRQIIAVAIWIPYLNMSERVRETFVNKYGKRTLVDADSDLA